MPLNSARQLPARPAPDGDAVRQRILDAAEEVFAERGYLGATTRELAARAGIGKRMLFYYFPTKDAVYRAVLERVVTGLVAIHDRLRSDPAGGLAEAVEGISRFTAANLRAVKVWLREVIDGGPHLAPLARRHLAPLFAQAEAEVARGMQAGALRPGDPRDVVLHVGGLTLFYFLVLPLLDLLWDHDPLAPATVAARAAAARDCLLYGVAAPATRDGGSS